MWDRTPPDLPPDTGRPIPIRWEDLPGLAEGTRPDAGLPGGPAGIDFNRLRGQLPELDPERLEAVAARLGSRPDLPRDLALSLAHHRIAVARPVLRNSPVLTEDDLLDVIDRRSREHHLAIARRSTVEPMVAEILVEMGDHDVLLTLLGNPGALLHRKTVTRLIGACRHNDGLRAPLLRRPELTYDQAQALALWVGDDLRRELAARFGISLLGSHAGQLDAAAVPGTLRPCGPCEPFETGFDRAAEHGTVTGSTLVRGLIAALRRDDNPAIEGIFARLTGLPPFAVDRVLYNANPEPLAVVCRALSLKRPLFAVLFARLQGRRPYDEFRRTPEYRSALTYFNRLQASQAQRVLETWCRAPVTVWHNPGGWRSRAGWAM